MYNTIYVQVCVNDNGKAVSFSTDMSVLGQRKPDKDIADTL